MRGVIASVSGNDVTLTVAGWPASGSGTCSLFGWNNATILYTGTTATNSTLIAQRKGYADSNATLTITTTASPGTITTMNLEDGMVTIGDQLQASSSSNTLLNRGFRRTNTPDKDANLYLQIRVLNGTSNPASTTTLTVGMVYVEDMNAMPVSINATRFFGNQGALPVSQQGSVTVTASNLSSNLAQVAGTTTVTAGVSGMIAVGGNIAHSTAATSNPVQVGGRVITTIETGLVNNDTCYSNFTTAGQLVTKDYASAENCWSATDTKTDTTDLVAKASGGANIRNYVTGIQFVNTDPTTASEIVIKDGSTVIWKGYADNHFSNTPAMVNSVVFTPPLKGTAATAMNVAMLTTATNTIINVQGYQSF